MDDSFIDIIRIILEKEDGYLLPIKRLWYVIRKKPEYRTLTLEELTRMIAEDPRCKLYDIRETASESSAPWTKDKEPEMERMGFFLGARVMLVDRPLTKDALKRSVTRTVDNMQNVLRKAYDMSYANENLADYDGEKQLLEIMAKTRDLRRGVEKMLDIEDARDAENNK